MFHELFLYDKQLVIVLYKRKNEINTLLLIINYFLYEKYMRSSRTLLHRLEHDSNYKGDMRYIRAILKLENQLRINILMTEDVI